MRADLSIVCLHCGRSFLLASSALRCRLNAVAAGFAEQQAEKRATYAAQRAGRRQVVGSTSSLIAALEKESSDDDFHCDYLCVG